MRLAFYDSPEYRRKQSSIAKRNQDRGIYRHLKKDEKRSCEKADCKIVFIVKPADPKRFCSRSCSVSHSNSKRTLTLQTKKKIAAGLKGKISPRRGLILVPRVQTLCNNLTCTKTFTFERYKNRQYCSANCAITTIGHSATSPKASRGKYGIRPDIDLKTAFYSRWEANIARPYTHLEIAWEFAPKTFDLGGQLYTPDFFLPEVNMFVEVKNFWSDYSRIRDEKFRSRYPNIKLKVLLKDEYLYLENRYSSSIPEWEFKNS